METITTYGVGPDQPTYAQLREQNRVLAQALRIAIFLEGPENVLHEYELWCELIDNGLKEKFNEWYGERVLAALTATSQEGQHG